jgi:DNA gyrase/topoisomerase IV subunit B
MKAFNSIMPTGVKRYKGLGETNSDELAESTIAPNSRSLIQYTVEDVKDEIERIRRIESDKKQIFQYYGLLNRADLIGI